MSIVRDRTQKEIMDYIRTHSHQGKLTKSMLDIAKQIGYSNATIHRTLKALEEKGLIEVTAAQKPTEPNTIVFKGEINQLDQVMSKGVHLTEKVTALARDVEDYVYETRELLNQFQLDAAEFTAYKKRVMSITDLPGTDLEMYTVRKEADDHTQSTQQGATEEISPKDE